MLIKFEPDSHIIQEQPPAEHNSIDLVQDKNNNHGDNKAQPEPIPMLNLQNPEHQPFESFSSGYNQKLPDSNLQTFTNLELSNQGKNPYPNINLSVQDVLKNTQILKEEILHNIQSKNEYDQKLKHPSWQPNWDTQNKNKLSVQPPDDSRNTEIFHRDIPSRIYNKAPVEPVYNIAPINEKGLQEQDTQA